MLVLPQRKSPNKMIAVIVAATMAAIGAFLIFTGHAATVSADLDHDQQVNVTDLSMVLAAWGTTNPAEDIDMNGRVGVTDLSVVLSRWGAISK